MDTENEISHTHIHTHYSAKRKKEIPQFVTTWIDPEGIMLSEIRQTKTSTLVSPVCEL